MNGIRVAVAVCALMLLVQAPASAEDGSGAAMPVPDLSGVWSGDYETLRWNGPAEGAIQLRVVEQDGPNLKVEKSWKLGAGATPGDVHGALLNEAVEPLVGVIGFDGRTVYLAEEGDGGVYTGRLVGPDTLELVYFESGEQATAYRTILRRSE